MKTEDQHRWYFIIKYHLKKNKTKNHQNKYIFVNMMSKVLTYNSGQSAQLQPWFQTSDLLPTTQFVPPNQSDVVLIDC